MRRKTKEYNRDIETLAKQTGIPKESVAKNLNYIDENAQFWSKDLKTWSDLYLKNRLIQKPIDTTRVVGTELYNKALKLVNKQ